MSEIEELTNKIRMLKADCFEKEARQPFSEEIARYVLNEGYTKQSPANVKLPDNKSLLRNIMYGFAGRIMQAKDTARAIELSNEAVDAFMEALSKSEPKLFGMDIKVDPTLKGGEFRIETSGYMTETPLQPMAVKHHKYGCPGMFSSDTNNCTCDTPEPKRLECGDEEALDAINDNEAQKHGETLIGLRIAPAPKSEGLEFGTQAKRVECKCVYKGEPHAIEFINAPSGKKWAIGGTTTKDRFKFCPWCGWSIYGGQGEG